MEQLAGPDGRVYIVAAARTPIGKFGGALSGVPAVELGATAIRAAVERSGGAADAPGAEGNTPPPRRSPASPAQASKPLCTPRPAFAQATARCTSRAAWSR